MIPFPTLLEPFSECLLLGFLASLCARYVLGVPFIVFYFAHILVWMVFDFFLLKNLQVSYTYCKVARAAHAVAYSVETSNLLSRLLASVYQQLSAVAYTWVWVEWGRSYTVLVGWGWTSIP